ncbi:putative zinc finger, BED-type containing protein [Tanacetum coccineum]
MITSQEWLDSKWSKDAKGKRMQAYFLKESFWKNIVYTLKLTGPLVNVLRMVDGERKPAMGYIYKAMDKAKDAIQNSFPNREDLYEKTIKIIVVEFMSFVFGVKR